MSDKLVLAPEAKEKAAGDKYWKVLIVDDEKDVHDITKLVLEEFSYKNKGILFLSAFSKKEGIELINKHPDTAVVLLDVVMENDTSGLELANYIRKEKDLQELRIILRTGQSGIAPERKVIDTYDIDGYQTKNELTTDKLYTAVRSGLKNFHDIQSAHETQRKLLVAETTAELREVLTSMIIHDLRNPLSIIQSIFGIWKANDSFRSEGNMKNQFELLCRASETISEMILEQLNLSQLESGKYVLEREIVDVNELIHLVYSGFAHEFNDKLQYKYTASPKNFPKLSLDRELFRRIIVNLLSNAIRYTREGSIAIRCQFQKKKAEFVVTVSDTGAGIKEEDLPRLFDRFYQTETSQRRKCTFGIGLSFCDFAVQTMGGEITVNSVHGKGSEFRISIPVKTSEEVSPKSKDVTTQESENSTDEKEVQGLPLKVLLVDDNKTIRRIMKMTLNKLGIVNVDEARNGQFAIERLSENDYDVLFLDITMPVLSGIEVVKRVKPKYPNLTIIMLTAEDMKHVEEDLNISAFITKPFSFESISDTLKSLNLLG